MAYMSQQKKKELAPGIKAVLKKYGVKASIGVKHHSTLVINIKSGDLDIIGNLNAHSEEENKFIHDTCRKNRIVIDDYFQVNQFRIEENFTGGVKDFLMELHEASNVGNFDKSDYMTDYYHVGFYVDINCGIWNKPYIFNGAEKMYMNLFTGSVDSADGWDGYEVGTETMVEVVSDNDGGWIAA